MKYSLLLLSLIAAQAQAQIIYTDVIPDTLFNVSGDTCHLDLNNDGITDLDLRYHRSPNSCIPACVMNVFHESWILLHPLGANAAADTFGYPMSLDSLRVIDGTLDWSGAAYQHLAHTTSHCMSNHCAPWINTGEWVEGGSIDTARYLGILFDIGGSMHYGWARLSIPNSFSFTLKDYAYNSVPDEFILAGDTGSISTAMEDLAHLRVQISPNPFTSTLSITIASEKPGDLQCAVRALTGEVLVKWTMERASGRSSFSRDLTSLASGAYLLEVMTDGERVVRKIMKE